MNAYEGGNTSTLRAGLLRTRQNYDFTLGVESQTFPFGSWRSSHITGVTHVTDQTCSSDAAFRRLESSRIRAMSSIEDVRASEKKVKEVLDAVAKARAQDQN
jgi:hypothetical protein